MVVIRGLLGKRYAPTISPVVTPVYDYTDYTEPVLSARTSGILHIGSADIAGLYSLNQ